MEEEGHTMPSLNDMSTEIAAAGNAPAAIKEKGKGKNLVKLESYPWLEARRRTMIRSGRTSPSSNSYLAGVSGTLSTTGARWMPLRRAGYHDLH